MPTPTDPAEALLQRLLLLQRAGTTISEDAKARLEKLFAAFERDLRRLDPTGVQPRYREGRRKKFMERARKRVREFVPEYEAALKDQLAPLGRQQAEAARDGLIATLGETGERVVRNTPVTQSRIRAILNAQPFQGRTLREHTRRLGVNTIDRIGVQVRLGMVEEESVGDIVRRVRGTRTRGAARGFTGGVWQTTTRDAEAVVRTAVTHVSNEGMLETFRENRNVVKGVRFVATWDDRTTDICLALSGTEWPLDSDDIVVPGEGTHIQCRSVLVPTILWDELGLEPPPEGDRVVRDLSTVSDEDLARKVSARRRTGDFGDVVKVPADKAAADWFREQRTAVQNRMVGRGRAELFRRGEIDLKDLITKDRRSVPLRDLLEN